MRKWEYPLNLTESTVLASPFQNGECVFSDIFPRNKVGEVVALNFDTPHNTANIIVMSILVSVYAAF